MLETRERAELWELIMDSEEECSEFISGWFFGEKLENLTRYDVMDFLTWSLFEGRNMEVSLNYSSIYYLIIFIDLFLSINFMDSFSI